MTPENEIIKTDLETKIAILNQIKNDFETSRDEFITGISIKFKDRSITLNSYLEDADRKLNYGNVINDVYDLLIPKIISEIAKHSEKINLLN